MEVNKETIKNMISNIKYNFRKFRNNMKKIFSPKNKAALIMGTIAVFLFILCILLLVFTINIKSKAAKEAYISAKPQAVINAYEKTGKKIYNIGEQRYHTSNEVEIKIDGIEKVSSLEALKVTDIYYYFNSGKRGAKSEAWYKIIGTGIYTVNMELAEIITDETRNYILIKVPNPTLQLSDFDVTVKQFYFDKKMFEGVDVGEEVAAIAEKEGYKNIKAKILSNQDYFKCAKKSAELFLINLAKQCNPNVNINVEVEFFN